MLTYIFEWILLDPVLLVAHIATWTIGFLVDTNLAGNTISIPAKRLVKATCVKDK